MLSFIDILQTILNRQYGLSEMIIFFTIGNTLDNIYIYI